MVPLRFGLAVTAPSLFEATRGTTDCCNFAPSYLQVDWSSEAVRDQFVAAAVAAESNFFATPNVSFDGDTGMTYDGHALNNLTGELLLGA